MMATAHPLVEQYLRSLDDAARRLPRHQREELTAEIRDHLAAGLAPDAGEADIRNFLDNLGSPAEIVAAAQPEGPARPVEKRGPREIAAIVFLLTGFPPFLGWFVGLGLLLWSPLWTARQKLLGTLVWPGGLSLVALPALIIGGATTVTHCNMEGTAVPAEIGGNTVTTLGPVVETCTTTGGATPFLLPIGIIVAFAAPFVVAIYLWRAAAATKSPSPSSTDRGATRSAGSPAAPR
ncbi:MAG: HAAS signaling domain-containing protein [Acidimicrobiia bacterium]